MKLMRIVKWTDQNTPFYRNIRARFGLHRCCGAQSPTDRTRLCAVRRLSGTAHYPQKIMAEMRIGSGANKTKELLSFEERTFPDRKVIVLRNGHCDQFSGRILVGITVCNASVGRTECGKLRLCRFCVGFCGFAVL